MSSTSFVAAVWLLGACAGLAAEPAAVTLTVDFGKELGTANPRVGFLGGLRDEFPDALIQPLNPALWRIGHQFRGRIKEGLTGAVTRVEGLGGKYKLVMSDLIESQPKDWGKYESDVKKLVAQTGARAKGIIWEPVNEPDISHKPIEKYYKLYGHAFKALREAEPEAALCGPGFAFPSYEKYRPFLEYCKERKLECNYVAWHYTGWDAHFPEQAKWQLGKMREFVAAYPEQKIREIHCDEWGAGPDKPSRGNPGRLHPGRAVVWFHYLENVYQVERACRANWGHEDDYLGGIVTPKGEPYPVYHVYRWYGATKGQTRVAAEGNGKELACLAAKQENGATVLLGSLCKGARKVTLELRGLGLKDFTLSVQRIPGTELDKPLAEAEIPAYKEHKLEQGAEAVTVTLENVAENEAYRLVFAGK